MTIFKVGTTVDTGNVPNVVVDVDPAAPLLSGKYVFQLTVTDSDHAVSNPTTVTVVVLDNVKPTAVIDQGSTLTVPFGQRFTLTANGSHVNPPAQFSTFSWTLIAAG